jgi:hypothetical protein
MADHELARLNYLRSIGYVTNVLRMLVTVTKNPDSGERTPV